MLSCKLAACSSAAKLGLKHGGRNSQSFAACLPSSRQHLHTSSRCIHVCFLNVHRAMLNQFGTQLGASAHADCSMRPCVVCLSAVMCAGKMELFSAAFYPAVLTVLDNPQLLAFGTVPVARYGRTIPQVCVIVTWACL